MNREVEAEMSMVCSSYNRPSVPTAGVEGGRQDLIIRERSQPNGNSSEGQAKESGLSIKAGVVTKFAGPNAKEKLNIN